MKFLAEATAVLSASLDYGTALQSVAGLLVPELADWCVIDVVAADGTLRRAAVAHRDPDQEAVAWDVVRRWPLRADAREGVPKVIRTGVSEVYPELSDELLLDVARHPEYVEALKGLGLRSAMIVPLAARGCVLGALSLWSVQPERRYGATELARVEELARWASLALDNARLFTESDVRLHESESLLAVTQALSSTLDATEAMRRVARQIAHTLGADMVGAFLADADARDLRPIAGYRVPKDMVETFLQHPIPLVGHDVLETAWRTGEPTWTDDVPNDPRVDRESVGRFPHQSDLFVPMVAKGVSIGGFFVIWWHERHRFTPEEIRLVQAISAQAAVFVESARLYAEAERRRQAAEELARVARVLTESLDVAEVGERIAQSVLGLFGAGSSIVRLLEPDGSLTCLALAGIWLEGYKPGYQLPPGTGMVGRAVAERRPVWTADVQAESSITLPPQFLQALGRAGHHAVLAVPLQVKDEMIGALSIAHPDIRSFSDAEVRLLQTFGDQAALAIRNVQLLAREQAARRKPRRPAGPRTSSWRCSVTSCAIRSPPSARPCASSR